MVTLSGGTFTGRTINESFTALQDTCFWNGSKLKQLTLGGVDGGVAWTVASTNTYGADMIAVTLDWAQYYENAISTGTAPYKSCYVNVVQQMLIDNCGGTPAMVQYGQPHDTKNILNADGSMTAQRDNATTSGAIGGQ
jgi:hypothetical protein